MDCHMSVLILYDMDIRFLIKFGQINETDVLNIISTLQ